MVAMFVTRPRPKKDAMTAPPRKKRKADRALDEISFDDTARADYLTGFHKRKVQRQKQAQDIAAEKARVERIALRKEVREQRSKDLEDHVRQVNDALRAACLAGGEEVTDDEDEDEWTGLDDDTPKKKETPEFVDHEEEYIDEDKYTTVTVEAVDVDREGMHALSGRHTSDSEESDESDGEGSKKPKKGRGRGKDQDGTDDKDAKTKSKDKKEWPKKKKKKFRYENKLERQISKLNKKSKQSKRQ